MKNSMRNSYLCNKNEINIKMHTDEQTTIINNVLNSVNDTSNTVETTINEFKKTLDSMEKSFSKPSGRQH
jgi:uridine kinase